MQSARSLKPTNSKHSVLDDADRALALSKDPTESSNDHPPTALVGPTPALIETSQSKSVKTLEVADLHALPKKRKHPLPRPSLANLAIYSGIVALIGAAFYLASSHGVTEVGKPSVLQTEGESSNYLTDDMDLLIRTINTDIDDMNQRLQHHLANIDNGSSRRDINLIQQELVRLEVMVQIAKERQATSN